MGKIGIKQVGLGLVLLGLLSSCSANKTTSKSVSQSVEYSAKVEHAFVLDGFVIGESQPITEQKARDRGLLEIDRLTYDESQAELYAMLDMMITYEGDFFGHAAIVGLHFKANQLRFVVFSAAEEAYMDLFTAFNSAYGDATQQGDTLSTGEAFKGDNTVWFVKEQDLVVGYVSLLPRYRQAEDPDDSSLKVTIFPFSATPEARL